MLFMVGSGAAALFSKNTNVDTRAKVSRRSLRRCPRNDLKAYISRHECVQALCELITEHQDWIKSGIQ